MMKSIFYKWIGMLVGMVALWNQTNAQIYEAEEATLSNGASAISCGTCSGSEAVNMGEGDLHFNINFPVSGLYNIYINVSGPNGEKINIIRIGENSADFSVKSGAAYQKQRIVSEFKISAGKQTISLVKSWGWIHVDYLEIEKVDAGDRFNLTQELVTPDPLPKAQSLYDFLLDHYNKRIISGGMTLNDINNSTWLDWINEKTGKEVALLGLDFMHSVGKGTGWINDTVPAWDAKTWYERNGIPAMMWHWRDPSKETEAFYTDDTEFDISKISDENSAEYKAMLQDIDKIAGIIKMLDDQNVPMIWRPLHEAAGGWFWWGAKGPEPFKELWQLMFDRMVNHHGITNLIWVYTAEPGDDAWYPGDEYVDIIGRDIYKDGDHGSHGMEFGNLNAQYEGKKIIALSENGSIPDPDNLLKDEAGWSWFMPWYDDYTTDSFYNPESLWEKIMNHDYVITLDEMPDLSTYQRQEVSEPQRPEDPEITSISKEQIKSEFKAYPTMVKDYLIIEGEGHPFQVSLFDMSGKRLKEAESTKEDITLSFKGMKPGMYLLKINHAETIKIFKE